MSEVHIDELCRRNPGIDAESVRSLAAVANAISLGIGAMIRGTLMEEEFREVLKLEAGETVTMTRK